MSNYTTENNYAIAESDSGELYFYISAKSGVPQSPKIIYDGKDHALFCRQQDNVVILDYINPEVRDKLRKSRVVIVVETIGDYISKNYLVDVDMVDKIPVDWSKIGLKTWEEIALGK